MSLARFYIAALSFLIVLHPIASIAAQDTDVGIDIPASESDDESFDEPVEKAVALPKIKSKSDDKKTIGKQLEKPSDSRQDAVAVENNIVILQGLNKVTGRVYTFDSIMGAVTRFENLEIISRKCIKSKPDKPLENSALLEIREVKANEEPKQVFLGWMFSSSPSISALEHPIYDIAVISCEARSEAELDGIPSK